MALIIVFIGLRVLLCMADYCWLVVNSPVVYQSSCESSLLHPGGYIRVITKYQPKRTDLCNIVWCC
jgi:hypothetical protein